MEIIHYLITCTAENPLSTLFQANNDGHLRLGFAGRSKEKMLTAELFDGEVEFIGYVMEGFISYFIAVKATEDGLQLSIRKTGSNRDQYLDGLIEDQVQNLGCTASKVAA